MARLIDMDKTVIITRKALEDGRYQGYCTYGYFKSYCDLNPSCERCDKQTAFWCRVKRKIEKIQTRRILRICKEQEAQDG